MTKGVQVNKTVRWKQRFQNFEKAYSQLENTLKIQSPSEAERAGLIQFFELAFELSWKTLKDYLESEGTVVNTPRETIKKAFQYTLIKDGHAWMQALDDRNLTTHTYEEAMAIKVEQLIREKYAPLLQALYQSLLKKI